MYLAGIRELIFVRTIIKLNRFDILPQSSPWLSSLYTKYSLHEKSPEILAKNVIFRALP